MSFKFVVIPMPGRAMEMWEEDSPGQYVYSDFAQAVNILDEFIEDLCSTVPDVVEEQLTDRLWQVSIGGEVAYYLHIGEVDCHCGRQA